jgi:hypothetical protein
MKRWILVLLFTPFVLPCFGVDIPIYAGTAARFASVEEGKRIITARDVFIASLNDLERQALLFKSQPVSEAEFLDFIGQQVIEWQSREIEEISRTLQAAGNLLARLSLRLPETVFLIRTTGKEEGEMFYTRQNAIFYPYNAISRNLFIHELFHIYSRYNPEMRDRLYQIIGFHRCLNEIELPESLLRKKITNPDAPSIEHYLVSSYKNVIHLFVPVLFFGTDYQGGNLFDDLQFRMMAIEEVNSQHRYLNQDGNPVLVSPSEMADFYSQVGENTDYIIHPEEIMADNFVLLANREQNLKTPRIVAEMEALLAPAASGIDERLWTAY